MSKNTLYVVEQGDGLKTHLSFDPKGDKTLCVREIQHYGKSVELAELLTLQFFDSALGTICERCLEISGTDKDGVPNNF